MSITSLAKNIMRGGVNVLSYSWSDFSFSIKNIFKDNPHYWPSFCEHVSGWQLLQDLRSVQASDSYINCGQKSLINQTDIVQSAVVKP